MSSFNPNLPLSQASTIPATWYLSPEMAERERRLIFSQTWQFVGRLEQLEQKGSFLTAEIANEPILIVRGNDGELRGFYNVCRHRAAILMTGECGTVDKLRCRYHGWTYDLAGKLRGVPEWDGVENFTREENGLVPITVAVWNRFIWVHLGQPSQTLEEFLSPLVEWAKQNDLGSLVWHSRKIYDLKCNWKLYCDNYLDGGYHVHTIHPGLASVIDYSQYKTNIFEYASVQTTPLEGTDSQSNVSKTRKGQASYWFVYPNFMLNHSQGVMDTNWVLPIDTDRCRVIFDFYFDAQTSPEFCQESIAVAEQVQAEDIQICEDVQKGLRSRSYSTGRFSVKREIAGYHFHRLLARHLDWESGSAN